jgi:hypothetical protein
MNRIRNPLAVATAAAVLVFATSFAGEAQAGREVKNNTRTSVNKNVNSNRNVNVNQNVNKNVNVNANRHVDIDVDVDHDRHRHPIGTAVAVGATVAVTSAIIGSTVYALPPACVPVVIGNAVYQQCGSVWYQPQYFGTSVQYIVINPPRY